MTGLLDNKNLELWNTLSHIHTIEIRKKNRLDYLVYSKNDTSTIFVPFDKIDSASFTHELLHIYLRTKNVFIGACLKLSIKDNKILSKIFSDALIEHIGNCLDHIKMLPEFIRLGYNKNEFLSDHSINKLTKEDVANIKKHFSINILIAKIYTAYSINNFIGKYFSANACPNESFNYTEELAELKKIDEDLFKILEAFLIDWKSFDYEDTNDSYHSLAFDFIKNLETWANKKIIS